MGRSGKASGKGRDGGRGWCRPWRHRDHQEEYEEERNDWSHHTSERCDYRGGIEDDHHEDDEEMAPSKTTILGCGPAKMAA